jgi:hypothetical protein
LATTTIARLTIPMFPNVKISTVDFLLGGVWAGRAGIDGQG